MQSQRKMSNSGWNWSKGKENGHGETSIKSSHTHFPGSRPLESFLWKLKDHLSSLKPHLGKQNSFFSFSLEIWMGLTCCWLNKYGNIWSRSLYKLTLGRPKNYDFSKLLCCLWFHCLPRHQLDMKEADSMLTSNSFITLDSVRWSSQKICRDLHGTFLYKQEKAQTVGNILSIHPAP